MLFIDEGGGSLERFITPITLWAKKHFFQIFIVQINRPALEHFSKGIKCRYKFRNFKRSYNDDP